MKIDFTDISIPTGIDKREQVRTDVRRDFANVIYRLGTGIEAHALALKIYNADGPEDFTDQECVLISRFAGQCSPAFIDAMNTFNRMDNVASVESLATGLGIVGSDAGYLIENKKTDIQ